MQRFFAVTAAFVAAATLPVLAAQKVTVPAGTSVPLVSDDLVAIGQEQPGTELYFSVSEPVVVGGYVVIPKGAKAVAKVVGSGGAHTHMSFIPSKAVTFDGVKYVFDYVESADGGKIKLNGATMTAEPVQGKTPMLGVHQSSGIALTKGAPVTATVDSVVHVTATEKSSAPSSGAGYEH